MAFDREIERKKAQDFISHSFIAPASNAERISRAKELAEEELLEFRDILLKNLSQLEHLTIYADLIKETLFPNFNEIMDYAHFFIKKEYTQNELDEMPDDVYARIVQSSKKRAEFLRTISKKYNI